MDAKIHEWERDGGFTGEDTENTKGEAAGGTSQVIRVRSLELDVTI